MKPANKLISNRALLNSVKEFQVWQSDLGCKSVYQSRAGPGDSVSEVRPAFWSRNVIAEYRSGFALTRPGPPSRLSDRISCLWYHCDLAVLVTQTTSYTGTSDAIHSPPADVKN
ncbi:hypothetical protein BaRGS_00012272 [Batillaria attramentaria]|uniref:Uncharacterized protein n=1 Tax=Batillaria attramentaria TaxID=370345 RepID=A0ABD0LBB7_9CAEN